MAARPRAWHAIIALEHHTQTDNVMRGMPSWTLDNKHGRTISGVVITHTHCTKHTLRRRQAWYAIIALG